WNEELDAYGAVQGATIGDHDPVNTQEKVAELLRGTDFSEIRVWAGLRSEQMTLDSFLRHRTGHGMSRYRLESLPDEARDEVVTRVRDRLADAGPDAFVDRSEVIYATAVAS
ncbi:MAG TPA: hypothetical protein VHJ82_04245, partial [Actinomycetota bacterium]|nr:hypothetical protein [Actinomycetota bacterium]